MSAQFDPARLTREITESLSRHGLSTKDSYELAREVVNKARSLVKSIKKSAPVTITDSFSVDQRIRIQIRTGCERKPREVLERYLRDRGIISVQKYPPVERFRISDAYGHDGLPAKVYLATLEMPKEAKKLKGLQDALDLMSDEDESAILTHLTDKKPE